jgi:hypothetical protein
MSVNPDVLKIFKYEVDLSKGDLQGRSNPYAFWQINRRMACFAR